MEVPYLPTETSANFARDWPDARGIWLSHDKSIYVYLNRKDHMSINYLEKNGDFALAYSKLFHFVKDVNFFP
jgi:protein-arginine kinase